jgi:hypothetical protein
MTRLHMKRELSPLTRPTSQQTKVAKTAWHQVVAKITDPDLIMIVAFCAIGLLITLNVMLRFPNLGALIESYNQF